jgi:hypothetical protein
MKTILTAVGIAAGLALAGAIYFLPTIIGRKSRNAKKIFVLNLLGAWTGIFWVVALLWAVFSEDISRLLDEQRERQILSLAERSGGKITPLELAQETNLPLKDAKGLLEALCQRGTAEVEVTEEGNLVYVFRGFLSEQEKASSKSPLDA